MLLKPGLARTIVGFLALWWDRSMSLAEQYVREGPSSIDEMIADQRVSFPRDPRDLLGDFWPAEESVDDFVAALREWRRIWMGPA